MHAVDRDALAARYRRVRAQTEAIAEPLSAEDMLVQSMPDASPTKWHLAHTTWFFEEFVLARFVPGHRWDDERWRVLFNSYYEGVGPQHARPKRGVLSRPSIDEVRAWRSRVDEAVLALSARGPTEALGAILLGTHHEQQHQELMLADAKHALWSNPLRPAYAARTAAAIAPPSPRAGARWLERGERVARLGAPGDDAGFAFDNERPAHKALVGAFRVASRPVTNGEYARFIDDGGYARAELWLSDGWAASRAEGWRSPLYWEPADGGDARAGRPPSAWREFTLHGPRAVDLDAPVAHVSFYEADAYARWAGARLPTEQEWEVVASEHPIDGNFLESGRLAPTPPDGAAATQLFGDVWEWTASAYLPYPRFRPLDGALGEYNGKFMSGQMVLRGGSCFSPRDHLRATYRNFFPAGARWQASGIRLASDPEGA